MPPPPVSSTGYEFFSEALASPANYSLPTSAVQNISFTNFGSTATVRLLFNYTRLRDGCNETTHKQLVAELLNGSQVRCSVCAGGIAGWEEAGVSGTGWGKDSCWQDTWVGALELSLAHRVCRTGSGALGWRALCSLFPSPSHYMHLVNPPRSIAFASATLLHLCACLNPLPSLSPRFIPLPHSLP